MKARNVKYTLNFRFPAGTSKGVLTDKDTWFILLEENGKTGIGECSVIPAISPDYCADYPQIIDNVIESLNNQSLHSHELLENYPSIAFGLEMAQLDLKTGGKRLLFNTSFTKGEKGIPINGLVWIGSKEFMEKQIAEKLNAGFRCIKLKIGSLDFQTELDILSAIRKNFKPSDLELRLDANGAFGFSEALDKLKQLSGFTIHSVEQPIKKGYWNEMAEICSSSPIPIALDEELSGISVSSQKEKLLTTIKPQYLILKPGMLGGFEATEEWIALANKNSVKWWVTSALESNIGLNAIAQWTSTLGNDLPQGLGTGKLYHNNIDSPLEIIGEKLFYTPSASWNITPILS